MAIDSAAARSRRAVLVGSIGAVAALAAQAIGRPVAAANGDPLIAGSVVTDAIGSTGVSTSNSNGFQGTTSSFTSSGIYGENTGGAFGVYGRSNTGVGVGVFGESTTGTGVVANSSGGTAFEAQGRVKFSTAGLASVTVGTKSKQVTPGFDVTTSSIVLCTLETNQAGLAIQRVAKNTTTDKFTVYLSVKVATGKTAKVAWFVIG